MRILALLTLCFCTSAFAEDGLVVHFTIKKINDSAISTYSNGVLMRLTEASTMTFPGQYEMRLESRAINSGQVNLIVTLKDLASGKPMYAGSGSTTLKVGASGTVPLDPLKGPGPHYEVFVDTAYGQLPVSAK